MNKELPLMEANYDKLKSSEVFDKRQSVKTLEEEVKMLGKRSRSKDEEDSINDY